MTIIITHAKGCDKVLDMSFDRDASRGGDDGGLYLILWKLNKTKYFGRGLHTKVLEAKIVTLRNS